MPELPPLIPRETLFGNPEKASPKISPDGRLLAYIAPDEGVLNLWVRTLGSEDDRVVTRDRKRGIRSYLWAYDNRHLLYVQDFDGDENWHVWSANLETGIIRDLTPFLGAQARVVEVSPDHPTRLLVALNHRDPTVHDVYSVDIETGAVELVELNPGDVVDWVADPEMRIRACQSAREDGGFTIRVRETVTEPWRDLATWGPEDEGHIYGFNREGTALIVGLSTEANTLEGRLLDLASGHSTTFASRDDLDLADLVVHPVERVVQMVGYNRHRMEWTALDPRVAEDLATLQAMEDAEFHLVSRDLDDRLWIVLYVSDREPASYYLYDRQKRERAFLFRARPALSQYTLAEMRPVEIRARDGLNLVSYLTLPPGIEPRGLPLVLNVHGGPWARDTWGYDPEAQWLANRGYACLQVNYRGSTGFGKAFLHAADRQWSRKMHDDLIDAVQWAIEQGIADPRRVAIYGGSYGGYAALVGVTFTPEVFACAVDIVGPSSLRTLLASIPPYWEPLRKLFISRVGDPETEPEFLDSCSPLYRADKIVAPLLIAQGANDPRVKQAESEQIVQAMRERGKEVEYVLFEDEGHGFARPENRLRFYGIAEGFLARHLGGRCEPVGEEQSCAGQTA